ncbi:killer suppression protein [bacterium]|nr:MAG: killer suppression protein [bacterium]
MKIIFRDRSFNNECNNFKLLRKHQGELRAKKIRQRLDDLSAAECLEDMKTLPGRCHELKGDRHKQISLDFDHPWRLIFTPVDDPPVCKPDGGIDWKNVKAIEIIGIEDTHE